MATALASNQSDLKVAHIAIEATSQLANTILDGGTNYVGADHTLVAAVQGKDESAYERGHRHSHLHPHDLRLRLHMCILVRAFGRVQLEWLRAKAVAQAKANSRGAETDSGDGAGVDSRIHDSRTLAHSLPLPLLLLHEESGNPALVLAVSVIVRFSIVARLRLISRVRACDPMPAMQESDVT